MSDRVTMPADICVARQTCRICGRPQLETVLDLGAQHIASIFATGDEDPAALGQYPLELVRCSDPEGCGLVQLHHTVSQRLLYNHYGYLSGTNEKMRRHLEAIAKTAMDLVDVTPGDCVLDIGCNDGTLLDCYKDYGYETWGMDPSSNVAAMASEKGHSVINDFFNADAIEAKRPGQKMKIITSIAMFYDLEQPAVFVRDVERLLADDGVWITEMSYLPFMLRHNSYDTICHEHLEYYTLRQLEWLTWECGLVIHRVEFNDINGGSFRIYLRKKNYAPPLPEDIAFIHDVREEERRLGLDKPETYEQFQHDIVKTKDDLLSLLQDLKQQGKDVYVYGASTKGNVILEYCGITNAMVPKAADRNPAKWGRHTLGSNIDIISEEQGRAEKPDYFLVLPWTFIDAFLIREQAYLENGGQFIMPLPEVHVVKTAEDVKFHGV